MEFSVCKIELFGISMMQRLDFGVIPNEGEQSLPQAVLLG